MRKNQIEAAIGALEEAIKGDDKAEIESKSKSLGEASAKMAERLYAQGGAENADANAGGSQGAGGDEVVDAEFEDVSKEK